MALYTNKPVVFNAIQWTGKNENEVVDFMMSLGEKNYYFNEPHIVLKGALVKPGEYMWKSTEDKWIISSEEIFNLSFIQVED